MLPNWSAKYTSFLLSNWSRNQRERSMCERENNSFRNFKSHFHDLSQRKSRFLVLLYVTKHFLFSYIIIKITWRTSSRDVITYDIRFTFFSLRKSAQRCFKRYEFALLILSNFLLCVSANKHFGVHGNPFHLVADLTAERNPCISA